MPRTRKKRNKKQKGGGCNTKTSPTDLCRGSTLQRCCVPTRSNSVIGSGPGCHWNKSTKDADGFAMSENE